MRIHETAAALGLALVLACAARPGSIPGGGDKVPVKGASPMKLASTAFSQGQPIPALFSGYGQNRSPQLAWDSVPAGVASFALVCRDPDAPMGTFIHWVVFNIPDSARGLAEAQPTTARLPGGAVQGRNSGRGTGYTGPRPPSGKHRYFFDLYALDVTLALDSTADAGALEDAMKGHVLAQAELLGTYTK